MSEGQQVVQGDPICEMTADNFEDGSAVAPQASSEPIVQAPAEKPISHESGGVERVVVPDRNADGVTVIEVSIAVGDEVAEGDTIIVLESDKASMEIPSPVGGKVLAISVKEGDSVAQGDLIADVEATGGSTPQVITTANKTTAPAAVSAPAPAATPPVVEETSEASVGPSVHAGPAVRALARELGVNLSNVASTGPRGVSQKMIYIIL